MSPHETFALLLDIHPKFCNPSQNTQQIDPLKSWKDQIFFDCGPEQDHSHSRGIKLRYQRASNIQIASSSSKTKGILVLTGQPMDRDKRNRNSGRWEQQSGRKHMEFIFFNESRTTVSISDQIKKDFEFAHSELGENRTPNKEWTFWNSPLHRHRIPVFVLTDNKNNPLSIGLAMMFRLPYKHSIHEIVDETSEFHTDETKPDLAESIFGYVSDNKALRGRIYFEPLIAEGNPHPEDLVATILSAPKPTYYPNYIKQPGSEKGKLKGDNYKTYMDKNAEIRGWKRYIIRTDLHNPEYE